MMLLALIEASILYASVYFAYGIALGGFEFNEQALAAIAPQAMALSGVMLLSLIAMGLYQLHQRIYFHEVLVRIVVGIAAGSVILAGIYYTIPAVTLEPRIAALAVLTALFFLLLLRFFFVRNVDENIFRHRTLIYGAGERSAAIFDLRRRADRRGFRIVGTVAAPGDTVSEDRINLVNTERTLLDVAKE